MIEGSFRLVMLFSVIFICFVDVFRGVVVLVFSVKFACILVYCGVFRFDVD